MDAKEIVKAFREHAEWAQANEWERPITLGDVLRKAADTIEELNNFQGSQCAKLLAQLSELRAENARLRAERDTLRNELCLKCGRYHEAHNGACDGCRWKGEFVMSKISEIQKIREFTGDNSGATYGVYSLIHNGKQQVFIRNGDSIGAVSHFLGEPASKCVNEIRDDVKQEFLAQLALQCIYKECGGCENWSGSDCTLVAPDTGCPKHGTEGKA